MHRAEFSPKAGPHSLHQTPRANPERIPLRPDRYVYLFSGIPFTSRTRLEGHAVRAMYACSGATDYYLETGDPAYWRTLETLWKDLADSKLYITGGVGARGNGEAFGDPYELPNAAAYSESCAAIGNMMWNWRMLAATGEARFTDVMERALYNTINAGMSLEARRIVTATRSSTRRAVRSAIRGTKRCAVRRTWSVPWPRYRAISTAPARTASTCTCMTTPRSTGISKAAPESGLRRRRIIPGTERWK